MSLELTFLQQKNKKLTFNPSNSLFYRGRLFQEPANVSLQQNQSSSEVSSPPCKALVLKQIKNTIKQKLTVAFLWPCASHDDDKPFLLSFSESSLGEFGKNIGFHIFIGFKIKIVP